MINRRGFLRVTGLAAGGAAAAACAPGAAPTSPSAPAPSAAANQAPGGQAEWDRLLAAAKSEGKLSVLTLSGTGYRKALDEFEAGLGITVDHEAAPSSSVWTNKVLSERKAGIYSFDVAVVYPNTALARMKPEGVWDPVRPLIFRPDVTDDKLWREGFDGQFMDTEKQLAFGWEYTVNHNVAIDTNQVKPDEIKSFQDLLDPRWKGKVIATDVRIGPTYLGMSALRERAPNADALVKKFLVEQEPAFTRESRQIAEALIRGRNPVGYGVTPANLAEFVSQGVASNVRYLDLPEVDLFFNMCVFLFNKAPHPNASKLFINWLLTKEGQSIWCKNMPSNSARTDVEAFEQAGVPTPGKKYFSSGRESTYAMQLDTQKYINGLVGITN